MFFHTIPLLFELQILPLQIIYNYNKYTEMWEHRSTEKGAVLTAEELEIQS